MLYQIFLRTVSVINSYGHAQSSAATNTFVTCLLEIFCIRQATCWRLKTIPASEHELEFDGAVQNFNVWSFGTHEVCFTFEAVPNPI